MSTMEKKAINYTVTYNVAVDNGYDYYIAYREESFTNHYEACRRADELAAKGETENIIVKHFGWDFYVHGGEEYAIHELDCENKDETIIEGPMTFIEGLQQLIQLQWANKLPRIAYKLVHHEPCKYVSAPLTPEAYIDPNELPL